MHGLSLILRKAAIAASLMSVVFVFLSSDRSAATENLSSSTYLVSGPSDFYFSVEYNSIFIAETTMYSGSPDTHLWLYDSSGSLIAANDDYYWLQSRIEIFLSSGTYRIRAGVCCGDPNRWYGEGTYTLYMSIGVQESTTTTSTTTTSTTTTSTTTTSTTTTSTTTTVPSSVVPTSTTTAPVSTTVQETSTTAPATTTSIPAQESTTTSLLPPSTTTTLRPVVSPEPTAPDTTETTQSPSTTIDTTPPVSESTTPSTLVEPPTRTTVATQEPQKTTTTIPEIQTTVPSPDNNPEVGKNQPDPDVVSPEKALDFATDPAILASIGQSAAAEIFSAINESSITEEQAAQMVAAVQNASPEVRSEFENAINIYGGKFDSYIPLNSTIDVATRRVIIAANVLLTSVAVSASGMSGGSTTSSQQSNNARREEEEEEAGEIAGDGVGWISQISIYKKTESTLQIDWRMFMSKFVYSFMNLGFTIAGAVVLFFTLSGTVRTVAIWSFGIAFVASMFLAMKEPE